LESSATKSIYTIVEVHSRKSHADNQRRGEYHQLMRTIPGKTVKEETPPKRTGQRPSAQVGFIMSLLEDSWNMLVLQVIPFFTKP
jgi:hypothetical protein